MRQYIRTSPHSELTPRAASLYWQYTMSNMFEDNRAPGDLGFDPLKFGENKATRARLELAELKNGRLAMLAFSGMIHQVRARSAPPPCDAMVRARCAPRDGMAAHNALRCCSQTFVTGKPLFASLGDIFATPL